MCFQVALKTCKRVKDGILRILSIRIAHSIWTSPASLLCFVSRYAWSALYSNLEM